MKCQACSGLKGLCRSKEQAHNLRRKKQDKERGLLKKALKKREYLIMCQKEEWEGSETANVKMNGHTGLLAN